MNHLTPMAEIRDAIVAALDAVPDASPRSPVARFMRTVILHDILTLDEYTTVNGLEFILMRDGPDYARLHAQALVELLGGPGAWESAGRIATLHLALRATPQHRARALAILHTTS